MSVATTQELLSAHEHGDGGSVTSSVSAAKPKSAAMIALEAKAAAAAALLKQKTAEKEAAAAAKKAEKEAAAAAKAAEKEAEKAKAKAEKEAEAAAKKAEKEAAAAAEKAAKAAEREAAKAAKAAEKAAQPKRPVGRPPKAKTESVASAAIQEAPAPLAAPSADAAEISELRTRLAAMESAYAALQARMESIRQLAAI